MTKLYIKEKIFTLADTFTVKDEYGNDKYFVESEIFTLGKKPLSEGMRILGAHIDSPRLDVKQNPLYEEAGLAYLDTHYYGGVKKYQWVTIPLALHGVVTKTDGRVIPVSIGEKDTDPVLCVTDLLIHLSAEQLEKKARVVIEGEKLDVLIGSMPLSPEKRGGSGSGRQQ